VWEIGEAMTARELMEWAAYERVYGPLLVHERIDLGFAQLYYYLVSLLGQKKRGQRYSLRDFLPKWMRDLGRRSTDDGRSLEATLKDWANAE
jgi:hypothetical protein